MIVKAETVVAWHRKGFRLFWTWKIRRGKSGRPACRNQVRRSDPADEPQQPALGRTTRPRRVAKYMVRHRKRPSQTWRTFLQNHVKGMVSVDFFTVPTIRFELCFCRVGARPATYSPLRSNGSSGEVTP